MKANEGTIVLPCDCEDKEQDVMYGKGNRLHNRGGSKDTPRAYCTVCSPSNQRVLRTFPASEPAPVTGYNSSKRLVTRKPENKFKSLPKN